MKTNLEKYMDGEITIEEFATAEKSQNKPCKKCGTYCYGDCNN